MMYKKLVKILRVCGDSNNSCGNCPVRENDGECPHGEWEFAAEKYTLQAADVIEKLNSQVESLCKTIDLYQKLLGGHPDPRGEDGEPGIKCIDCQDDQA